MGLELKGSNILHIYAQDSWHQEAYIVGNKEGLLELKKAIDQALKLKQGIANVSPTDGEGYEAYVLLVGDDEEDKFHQLKLPYTGKNMDHEVVFGDERVNIHHPYVLVKEN